MNRAAKENEEGGNQSGGALKLSWDPSFLPETPRKDTQKGWILYIIQRDEMKRVCLIFNVFEWVTV